MAEAPRSEYARRLDARRRDAVLQDGRKRVLGHARLAIFVAGVGFAWLALRWRPRS